jgi:hypothetical protein
MYCHFRFYKAAIFWGGGNFLLNFTECKIKFLIIESVVIETSKETKHTGEGQSNKDNIGR